MVSFEKELARIAPTKEAAEGAKDLKKVLRDLYDAAKRDDRRQVAKQVGEVSDAVSCVAAWKSTGELGYLPTFTPSSRRGYVENSASMAWKQTQ